MKKPPINKPFKVKAHWTSFATDGEATQHAPCDIIAIRYAGDNYSFIHKGQAYLHECLGEFVSEWELIK